VKLFGRAVTVRVVSFPDLYGGKLCAALDRRAVREFSDTTASTAGVFSPRYHEAAVTNRVWLGRRADIGEDCLQVILGPPPEEFPCLEIPKVGCTFANAEETAAEQGLGARQSIQHRTQGRRSGQLSVVQKTDFKLL